MNRLQFLSLLIVIFSPISCVSTPDSTTPPDWVVKTPQEPDYYLGIAGSQTGKESDDIRFAYNKALEVLASSISTSIKSDSIYTERETSDEGFAYSYESNIVTGVSQNLENIEIVDSYYSPEWGYWYYVRLGHQEWERIIEERAQNYREWVTSLFKDEFDDAYIELQTIYLALDGYSEAYGGEAIDVDILGRSGAADITLSLRGTEILSNLSLNWEGIPGVIEQRESIPLRGEVKLAKSVALPGRIPMVLIDQKGRMVKQFRTERDGTFDLTFSEDEVSGAMDYTLAMISPFGSHPLTDRVSHLLPKSLAQVEVNRYKIPLIIDSSRIVNGQNERIADLLGDYSPYEMYLADSTTTLDGLMVRLTYRSNPPNSFDMVFTYVTMTLILVESGEERVIWRSDEIKDGGLSEDQSRERALIKLLDSLSESDEIKEPLSSVLK